MGYMWCSVSGYKHKENYMQYTEEHMMEFPLESLTEINVKVRKMRRKYDDNRTIDVPVLHVSLRGDGDYISKRLYGGQQKREVVMSFAGFEDCEEIKPKGKEEELFIESDIFDEDLKKHVESLEEVVKNTMIESADSLEGYMESVQETLNDSNAPHSVIASVLNNAKEEWGQLAKKRIIKGMREADRIQPAEFGHECPFS